jgi:nucleoid-associated protein YgaU
VTADEPDISAIPPVESGSPDEDRWLTYLNYDQSIQQAVRRLGALSSANVDEFRSLLLKNRDRSRVKEYEAESIRRLQGEAFVGDEDLQRALIVLTAEDPRLGEELKRVVAASGKPVELDQTVAAIRAQMDGGDQPVLPAANLSREKAPEPLRPQPAPVIATRMQRQPEEQTPWTKRLAVFGVLAAAVVGLIVFLPRLAKENTPKVAPVQTASVPLRPSAAEDTPAAAAPARAPRQAPAAPTRTATAPRTGDIPKPAPSTAPVAAAEPDTLPPNSQAFVPPDTPPTPTPVAGANYKVVRGDMLSVIALKVYQDVSKFRLIQQANPNLRNGPDLILVDQVIYIPPAP